MGRKIIVALLLCAICTAGYAKETSDTAETSETEKAAAADGTPFVVFLPLGYDFLRLGEQNVYRPAIGVGFLIGEQNLPFPEVERHFFGLVLYQPFLIKEESQLGIAKQFHQIEAIFDGRINRHQLLFAIKSASDKPIAGGLHTFQTGIGWGYEAIRQPHVSLILGLALGISNFTLSEDVATPVLPLPLIRFGIDTQWFILSFDFLTGPDLSFTFAPKEKIRITGDMRMDYYRSINDLICEYILWYRLGDFAGIGAGFKHDSVEFTMSADKSTFEVQQSSVVLVIDLSLFTIQGGWIFDSHYLTNGIKTNASFGRSSPGNGFFVSVQGAIPITKSIAK